MRSTLNVYSSKKVKDTEFKFNARFQGESVHDCSKSVINGAWLCHVNPEIFKITWLRYALSQAPSMFVHLHDDKWID